MHDKYVFSDAQALTTLDSTGVVSSNVFDMELEKSGGNTILENDQLVGVVNITIPPNANQTNPMTIQLLSNDNADMTTGVEVELGSVAVSAAEMVAGCVKSIMVHAKLTQKFVGMWFKAVSSTLVTGTTVDAHWHTAPLTENDAIQKVPS